MIAPPSSVLDAEVAPAQLGDKALDALEKSRGLVRDGPDIEPLLTVAGVKSYAEFVRGTASAQVEEVDDVLIVTAMRNNGPRQGFEWTDHELQVPWNSTTQLGEALVEALSVSAGTTSSAVEEAGVERAAAISEAELHEAAEWMSGALKHSGYDADFSGSSLHEVERFFVEQTSEPRVPVPNGLLDEDVGRRLFAIGAYIGEVIRRGLGGRWSIAGVTDEDEESIPLELSDGSVIWPVKRAVARFEHGDAESLVAYGALLGLDLAHDA